MPTNYDVPGPAKYQSSPLRAHDVQRNGGIRMKRQRLRNGFLTATRIFAATVLLFTVNGCLATRSWVQDQLNPITNQLGQQESRLNDTDAKADRALAGLQNLHLERRLVLDSRHGPTFAFGSAALTPNAKREIA